jgi:hypothetical protein
MKPQPRPAQILDELGPPDLRAEVGVTIRHVVRCLRPTGRRDRARSADPRLSETGAEIVRDGALAKQVAARSRPILRPTARSRVIAMP